MRPLSKMLKLKVRLGTRFTKMSLLVVAVGMFVLIYSLQSDLNMLPVAAALLLVGGALVYISIVRANKKLALVQTGNMAKGSYQEWRNSFSMYNGRVSWFFSIPNLLGEVLWPYR